MRSLFSICMPHGCDVVQVLALSIGPQCRHEITRSDRQIGNISVTYVTLVPWWRERRRYVPMPQSWTIAGCLGLILCSSAENLMRGCTCSPFIPVCTGIGSGMQNSKSHSTTSQMCSIGLRSGDCGGHLSKLNSLSCSRNQSEMIWALWYGAFSMPIANSLKTCDICGIVLCDKTAHFRVAFYCGQPKAHLCNNHAV